MTESFLTPDHLLFAALLLAAALSLWFLHTGAKRRRQQEAAIRRAQQERDRAKCEALEEGLQDWLETLELPQLAERTKRQAAARQLRIVLVEMLMHGPRVR